MKLHSKQYLDLDPEYTHYKEAAAAILPVPYEGSISYLPGTSGAPEAILLASEQLELYDEILKAEPFRMGISTVAPPVIPKSVEQMLQTVDQTTARLIQDGKFVVILGGDHSITNGSFKPFYKQFPNLSVVQLDAHADLRDEYQESCFSHACTMSRIRELCRNTVQLGIRSLSQEEAETIKNEKLIVYTTEEMKNNQFDVNSAIDQLSSDVYITIDVDVFDWSVIRSTGTPDPGGLTWYEGLSILKKIFNRKNVIGVDIVELIAIDHDPNSPFAVAKLIYKILGYKLSKYLSDNNLPWPISPAGPLFKPGQLK